MKFRNFHNKQIFRPKKNLKKVSALQAVRSTILQI